MSERADADAGAAGEHELAAELAAELAEWFAEAARPLPWRDPATTPWAILVSEVMSQQTQVERVAPRWAAFLERWPTPADFAAASEADAIRAWDRLGYPRRALRLRECAIRIVEEHGGEVPASLERLLELPGLGPYTAGAVAAFAFGIPAPVVDTNVRRVLARAVDGRAEAWAPGPKGDLDAWRRATEGASRELALAVAAGAMELGAVICTARAPKCDVCPIAGRCRWLADGRPALGEDEAPRRRPPARFEGSLRQMRGAILAQLREHGALAERSLEGREDARFEPALEGLLADGLAARRGATIALPGHDEAREGASS